jgi:hypothetical protein
MSISLLFRCCFLDIGILSQPCGNPRRSIRYPQNENDGHTYRQMNQK